MRICKTFTLQNTYSEYRTRIVGYFLCFDWQENPWGINFRDHGSVLGTIIVGFSKYAMD